MTQAVITECSNQKKLKKNHSNCSSAVMSISQKFPKGLSTSFVPDYRHAAAVASELEGPGSSCRVDSGDSCIPKRKYISLHADGRNGFNVPIQVISTSKMSGSERKEMEKKLRGELDRYKLFQNRILSCIPTVATGFAASSSNDKHIKQHGSKCGVSRRFELTKQAPPPPGKSNAMLMKQCESILKTLMTHKYGWVFSSPVDAVKLKIPDYFTIIKHPMDLGTIKKNLSLGTYSSPLGFASDVRLTFSNAMTYNPTGNEVHIMADTLNKMFEKRWKSIGDKLATAEVVARTEAEATKPKSPPKKRKISPVDHMPIVPKSVRPKMRYDEKQKLRNRITSLVEHLPNHIIAFLRKQMDNEVVTGEEIEIDFETLSDDALFQLRELLDNYFDGNKSEPQAKVDSCEMESLVESGVSNLSTHSCKEGIDPLEEDVDIGGDDLPVPSYPPIEIEKDTSPSSSNCSSSSSGSDSSSNDSDSDSSSRSVSDVHVGILANSTKGNGSSGTMEQVKCGATYPDDANRTVSVLEQQDHHAQLEPVSVESEVHREENAMSREQVSPDKIYRAVLLKKRFADTIVKAREKTIDQNEKKDPEKVRHAREELERQQREEKARLEAEAKAVEIARRRAKAEAAAEAAAKAKRQREFEREKARQALLQMEKTVEINENSLFMKDLAMLRSAPGEHFTSKVEETSPDYLPEDLTGFNLGGSNLLEQFGLFMKNDEEEEEVDGSRPSSLQINDVEEGEID